MRERRMMTGLAAALAVVAMSSPAFASADAGVLEADDLPGEYESAGAPLVAATSNEIVVDGEACTQELGVIEGLTELVTVQFVIPATGETALSEAVTTFPDKKTARASFKKRSTGAADAIKCGSIDVLREGTSIATLVYEKLKFPKIGKGTSAWTVRPEGGTAAQGSTTIAFTSGTHVVFINTFGSEGSPTVKELKKIARRAERRL